jgi:hypothetical protein
MTFFLKYYFQKLCSSININKLKILLLLTTISKNIIQIFQNKRANTFDYYLNVFPKLDMCLALFKKCLSHVCFFYFRYFLIQNSAKNFLD